MFTESKYIAKFEGIYESENSLYFVMEYVEGTSLQAMFDTNHQFLES
jgi:serine/threonine protein kinase